MRTMRTLSLAGTLAGTLMSSLLVATALTPVRAADMTFERALNVDKEPQNWLLHHGNYQGHRFSQLKEINTDLGQESEGRLHRRARRFRRRRYPLQVRQS